MKYCTKCGKELFDEAVFCPSCGCPANPVQQPVQPPVQQPYYNPYQPMPVVESSGLATCAMVFAFLMPIVGLILGIIGTCKYQNPQLKNKSKSAIFVSIGVWIICFFLLTVLSYV